MIGSRAFLISLVLGSITSSAFSQTADQATPKSCLDNSFRALFIKGNPQRAKAFLMDALKLDPSYEPAIFNLGYINAMEENIPEAKKWLHKYVAVGGSQKLVAEAQHQLTELAHLEKVQSDPRANAERNYTILLLRAADFQAMGLSQEALTLCAKAAKLANKRYESYAMASVICTQSGLFDKAGEFLDQALKVAPASAQFGLSSQKFVIQDAEEDLKSRNDVAQYMKTGDFKQAEATLRALCIKHPHEKQLQIDLATIFVYARQEPSAKDILTPLSTDAKDLSIASAAKALLAKIQDADDFRNMLLDNTIQHPDLEGILQQIRKLKQEVGDNSDDADRLDQAAADNEVARQAAVDSGQQGAAAVNAIAGLFNQIGANNRKNEVEDKKRKIEQLREERNRLKALPRPFLVALAAFGEGRTGVAEMGFNATPSAERTTEYNFWYGRLKDNEGDQQSAADFYTRGLAQFQTRPIEERAAAAYLLSQNAKPAAAGSLLIMSQAQVFDPRLPSSGKKIARDLCYYGVRGLIDSSQFKSAIDLSEKGWRAFPEVKEQQPAEPAKGKRKPKRRKNERKAFSDIEFGMIHAEALHKGGKPAQEAETLIEIRATQLKNKAQDSDVGETEDLIARAYQASKNFKKAKEYARLAQSKNINESDLYKSLGIEK
jgi:Tfp pilus assembly protein PilF